MTNATKTLSAFLGVLVVLTIALKVTSNTSASEVFRSSVVSVDAGTVDKIVIDNPAKNKKIILSKANSDWMVSADSASSKYPANGSKIKRALEKLNKLQVKFVATSNPENYIRYKVDSSATRVLLYHGDTRLAGLVIGAPQYVSRREFNSYVRPINDQSVYAVDGFLGSLFSANVSRWRDKNVWQLNQEQIAGVDFNYPADSSYSMKKTLEGKWISEGDTLKQSSVSLILSEFSPLQAQSFVDSLSPSGFGQQLYGIQLHLKNGTTKTLHIKPFRGDSTAFVATASNYPYVFTLSKSMWKNSVLKSRKELLK